MSEAKPSSGRKLARWCGPERERLHGSRIFRPKGCLDGLGRHARKRVRLADAHQTAAAGAPFGGAGPTATARPVKEGSRRSVSIAPPG
jgi:hypothetical protein